MLQFLADSIMSSDPLFACKLMRYALDVTILSFTAFIAALAILLFRKFKNNRLLNYLLPISVGSGLFCFLLGSHPILFAIEALAALILLPWILKLRSRKDGSEEYIYLGYIIASIGLSVWALLWDVLKIAIILIVASPF